MTVGKWWHQQAVGNRWRESKAKACSSPSGDPFSEKSGQKRPFLHLIRNRKEMHLEWDLQWRKQKRSKLHLRLKHWVEVKDVDVGWMKRLFGNALVVYIYVYLCTCTSMIPSSIVVAEKEDCRMDEMTDAPSLKLPEGRFMRARP